MPLGVTLGFGTCRAASAVSAAIPSFVAIVMGQSQAVQRVMGQDNLGTVTPGRDAYLASIATVLPTAPAALINGATGGSALVHKADAANYWLNGDTFAAGPALTTAYAAIAAAGYSYADIKYVIWDQGDDDAALVGRYGDALAAPQGFSKAYLKTAMLALFDHILATLPNAVIYIDPIGRRVPADPNRSYAYIRECQLECVAERSRVRLGAENADKALSDGLHLTNTSIGLMGTHDALQILSDKGVIAPSGSMRVVATSLSGADITVDFTLEGGTDISPASAIKGFKVSINGFPATITSAVKETAPVAGQGRVKLTLSAAPLSTDQVRLSHFTDQGDDFSPSPPSPPVSAPTDTIRNNAATPMPLQSYAGVLRNGTAPTPIFTADFTASKTLTGLSATVARTSAGLTIGADGYFENKAANTVRFLYPAAFPHQLATGARHGLLVEEALKAKHLYARPSAGTLANHFVLVPSGLSVVSDTTNPGKNLTTGGQVWQMVNASGSSVDIEWNGGAATATRYVFQLCYKLVAGGACALSLSGKNPLSLTSGTWAHVGVANVTAVVGDRLRLTVPNGATILFTLANLVETYGNHIDCVNMPIDSAGAAVNTNGDDIYFTVSGISSSEGTLLAKFDLLAPGLAGAVPLAVRASANRTGSGHFLLTDTVTSQSGISVHRRLNSTTPNWSNNLFVIGSAYPLPMNVALRWKDAASAVFKDGLWKAVNTDAVSLFPTGLNEIALHRSGSTTSRATCVIEKLALYDKALGNRAIMEHVWV
jgi:hypothetical protein